jgi:hypothetical protein
MFNKYKKRATPGADSSSLVKPCIFVLLQFPELNWNTIDVGEDLDQQEKFEDLVDAVILSLALMIAEVVSGKEKNHSYHINEEETLTTEPELLLDILLAVALESTIVTNFKIY